MLWGQTIALSKETCGFVVKIDDDGIQKGAPPHTHAHTHILSIRTHNRDRERENTRTPHPFNPLNPLPHARAGHAADAVHDAVHDAVEAPPVLVRHAPRERPHRGHPCQHGYPLCGGCGCGLETKH